MVYFKTFETMLLFGFAISLFMLLYLWLMITCVEKVHMIKQIKVSKLTEGDWVIKPVEKNKKVIYEPSKTGLTKEDIMLLKKNKISRVTVKEGIPFVPSFLIAYIVTLILGNWFLTIF